MDDLMTLVRLVRGGDETALEKLFLALFPKVYGFVARRCPDRASAEIIVSEVWLQTIMTLRQIETDEDVLRSVFRITKSRLAAHDTPAVEQRRTA
ncbi:MAG: hypothetical protein Q8R92_16620 [Deltaproteobacteria bacterium]|nr:hypothetical protein [Deltaproteobacteria bacterium]